MTEGHWLEAWGQSHTTLSLFGYRRTKRTYRFIIQTAVNGSKVRVTLSNLCGKSDIQVGNATLAKCDAEGNVEAQESFVTLTFGGEKSVGIARGSKAVSDSVDIMLEVGGYMALSIYIVNGRLDSGNLMSNIKLKISSGNNTEEHRALDTKLLIDSFIPCAVRLIKLPLFRPIPLLESVEIYNSDGASEVVAFGDSLTQQGYWANAFSNRLKTELPGRYSFVNRSIMGNRVLRDCSEKFILKGWYGRRATVRLEDEVLSRTGLSHCLLFIGINDIIQYGTTDAYADEKPNPNELTEAIVAMSERLRAHGIKVMMFLIMPFGGAAVASEEKSDLRRRVNELLKEKEGFFDAVFDVGSVVAEQGKEGFVDSICLGPDNLHISAAGGERIAQAIDINFFNDSLGNYNL